MSNGLVSVSTANNNVLGDFVRTVDISKLTYENFKKTVDKFLETKSSIVNPEPLKIGFNFVSKSHQQSIDLTNKQKVNSKVELGLKNNDRLLADACKEGNIDDINKAIRRGAKLYDWGLARACLYNKPEAIQIMISKGASNFNRALSNACLGKHFNLVKQMLNCGGSPYIIEILTKDNRNPELKRWYIQYQCEN